MKSKRLTQLRPELGLEELAEESARLIRKFVPKQERYKVTDYPNARTIRFYTTRGLMDKPTRYNGQQAVYGPKHLVQLIVIKYLQAEYLSINKIREIMEGLSQDELLKLIGRRYGDDVKLAYLEAVSEKAGFCGKQNTHVAKKNREPDGERVWKRYNIEHGFEVHVREDFVLESQSHTEVLANRFRVILKEIMR